MLKLPAAALIVNIDARIRQTYGENAKLALIDVHPNSLSMHTGILAQGSNGHVIRLVHIFVDMTPAYTLAEST